MSPVRVSPPDTAAVILNFRGKNDTLACLQAIEAMPDKPGRVAVVDNGSGDDSLDAVARWLEAENMPFAVMDAEGAWTEDHGACRHVLIPLPGNTGYAAGNNAGIRAVLRDGTVRAAWILNNDTEPRPGALEALCGRMNDAGAAMAGSTLVYAHAPGRVQCAGGYSLNRMLGSTAAVFGDEALGSVLSRRPEDAEKVLDYVSGASLLVRRDALESIGLLAEEYFLYYEDTEFGLRAQRAGLRLVWAPHSIVVHKEGGASGAASGTEGRAFARPAFIDYLALRNRMYLMRKYFPLALPVTVAGYIGVLLKRVQRGQARRIPLVFTAMGDGLALRMGEPRPELGVSPDNGEKTVLFISARADFGGGPEHLWQLLRSMPASARKCVACPPDYPYYDRFRACVGNDNMFPLPHRRFSLSKLLDLRDFCFRHKVTVLHSHGKGAGLYSRLIGLMTGLPSVHTFHGVHVAEYGPWGKRMYRLYERFMSLFTNVGIAVSEGERRRIIAEGLMPETKLRLIVNGVPIPENVPDTPVSVPYRVVSISRFDYPKNSEFLVEILLKLKEMGRLEAFRFVVIGDGKGKEGLARLAWEKGVSSQMEFIGAIPNPHTFFSGALCYISTSRWEGMPLAVLEAMAHGLPPVVSDVVGNHDAVKDQDTGFLYPPGDAAKAAEAVCRLADEPDMRESMRARSREFVARSHDVRRMAMQTMEVLHDAPSRPQLRLHPPSAVSKR